MHPAEVVNDVDEDTFDYDSEASDDNLMEIDVFSTEELDQEEDYISDAENILIETKVAKQLKDFCLDKWLEISV